MMSDLQWCGAAVGTMALLLPQLTREPDLGPHLATP